MPTLDGREEIHDARRARSRARGSSCAARACRTCPAAATAICTSIARVAVPKKLTKEQKHLLEELAQDAAAGEAGRRRATTDEKPFFERVKDIFG